MHTIGKLAKRFQLSRSTLLYYDTIGLLSPSGRGDNDYRLYSDEEASRLEQICIYRRAGLPLEEIKRVLDSHQGRVTQALAERLSELSREIKSLLEQQRIILGILKNERYLQQVDEMNKERWSAILEAAGFSDDDMHVWHAEFERLAPEKHRQFLEYLSIPEADIVRIRGLSRNEWSRVRGS